MAIPVFDVALQSAASATGNGTAYQTNGRAEHLTFFIKWSSGGSGGVITLEEADTTDYAGTWSELKIVSQSGASRMDVVHVYGVTKAVRARISTAVSSGTVDVSVMGATN